MRDALRQFLVFLMSVSALTLSACGNKETGATDDVVAESAPAASQPTASASAAVSSYPEEAWFGNFHVHTSFSFDGYTNGSVATPDDAYRWAKGESIPGGKNDVMLRIKRPLDWYVVSDHAEYLGVFRKMEDPASPFSKLPIASEVTSADQATAFAAFGKILDEMSAGKSDPQLSDPAISKTIWQEVVATADKHNAPGEFTTFPGFEWTSNPGKQNLHRVVFFENSTNVPDLPFSALDSDKPEDLWTWMDAQRSSGATLLAIPHNGNASDGLMFPEGTSYGGSTLDAAYAETRMRNEPVYEITQIKGTSETHPDLSPNDEFGAFELWDYTLATDAKHPTHRVGSYVREALIRGLKLELEGKGNPFKYGFIGDSDTHNAAATIEEDNYSGKFANENAADHRLLGVPGFPEANQRQVREFSSGGLAGVWAKANTRDSLFDAIARKETFATSGTRLKLRFFGSFDYAAATDTASSDWLAAAYEHGVPMGGDLPAAPADKAPTFIAHAIKDPDGANLDRIQVVKGWVDADGNAQEKIFNVAMSGGRTADADGKVTPVGNTVDVAEATYANSIGAPALSVTWTDPEFDAAVPAVYYVRVLEIPTPRWSTYDAAKLGVDIPEGLPESIQERAWSSPIWYTP